MEIAIRPQLTRANVEDLVRGRLGDIEVTGHEEFTDGFFNAAHALALADGRHVVVKVAPDRDLKLLRYEVDLMATEIEFFERASAAEFPMPKVWHTDADAGLMIMDRLTGIPLPHIKDDLDEPELLALRREIGELSARVGTVSGERFGYVRKDGRTSSDSWADSFASMVADILADVADFDAPLPRPAEAILDLVTGHRALLDEVDRPALVHFDLWDGNIFVEQGETGWHVQGFIDGERALYGDPLAELVSLSLIPPAEVAAVVDGFLRRELTPAEEQRLCLYRIYLWLILLVEGGPRGYEPERQAGQIKWATEGLVKDLDAMES